MKEWLRHGIRVLRVNPNQVCSGFSTDWVDFPLFVYGYWLSLGFDFPPPQFKRRPEG